MKGLMGKLSVVLGLLAVLSLGACPPEPASSASSDGSSSSAALQVGDTVVGNFADYKVVSIPNGDSFNVFAVAEDTDNFYLYYDLDSNYKNGVLLTTIGNLDNSGAAITGNWDWGWGDVQRGYGDATNAVEIKIQFVSTGDGIKLITNNFDTGNLQLMTNKGPQEIKLVSSSLPVSNIGDVFSTTTVLEIKMAKSNIVTLAGKTLADVCFFAGVWGTWSMNGTGLSAGNIVPAVGNPTSGTTIAAYVKADGTTIYRAGKTTGNISFSPASPIGALTIADLLATNFTTTLVDVDTNVASIVVTVQSIITNVTNAPSDITLTYDALNMKYSASITTTTNAASGNQIHIDEVNATTAMFVYVDGSTGVSVTNSITLVLQTPVTFWYTGVMTNSVSLDGSVAMPCAANGWNNAAWPVTLTAGAYSNDVLVANTQIPNTSGIQGKVTLTGSWTAVDNVPGANIIYPDFTGFDPATQGIKFDGSTGAVTIYTK